MNILGIGARTLKNASGEKLFNGIIKYKQGYAGVPLVKRSELMIPSNQRMEFYIANLPPRVYGVVENLKAMCGKFTVANSKLRAMYSNPPADAAQIAVRGMKVDMLKDGKTMISTTQTGIAGLGKSPCEFSTVSVYDTKGNLIERMIQNAKKTVHTLWSSDGGYMECGVFPRGAKTPKTFITSNRQICDPQNPAIKYFQGAQIQRQDFSDPNILGQRKVVSGTKINATRTNGKTTSSKIDYDCTIPGGRVSGDVVYLDHDELGLPHTIIGNDSFTVPELIKGTVPKKFA